MIIVTALKYFIITQQRPRKAASQNHNMSRLEVIYVTRHGFRSNWVVDHETGEYTASIRSPTGIPSDPALAGKGEQQSRELAEYIVTLDPPVQRFYSSPFYRCIQTINPAVEKLAESTSDTTTHKIRGENGIGEWFGSAPFDHPSPAEPPLLHELFPRYDLEYQPVIRPNVNGETIDELHDRTAYALHKLIEQSDREGVRAIIICTHAATLIAAGRVLTGRMPDDIEEEDFRPFTCSLSKFVRRPAKDKAIALVQEWNGPGHAVPNTSWRDGNGVGGGWECELNGECSFLSGGEERGWRFSGDESFGSVSGNKTGIDAGLDLGVVIEGKRPAESRAQSHL
ncbi:histidine phosphatase superfamily [Xylogone sp. PMI_703]|nr:histidine phosphatase superfamily [Xylogone sp. PMI_703]